MAKRERVVAELTVEGQLFCRRVFIVDDGTGYRVDKYDDTTDEWYGYYLGHYPTLEEMAGLNFGLEVEDLYYNFNKRVWEGNHYVC